MNLIKITGCKNPNYWYRALIGTYLFTEVDNFGRHVIVSEYDTYLIEKEDATIITYLNLSEEQKKELLSNINH